MTVPKVVAFELNENEKYVQPSRTTMPLHVENLDLRYAQVQKWMSLNNSLTRIRLYPPQCRDRVWVQSKGTTV